ncbi:MAG TPA: AMP-binding protein [Thermoanaerobaculia bacterium]
MFEGELLAERTRITPDKLALVSVETGERLTYALLNQRSEAAAASLLSAGIAAGDRFGILGFNSVDYVALFFGAMKCGAIAVPLSTRATAHELQAIVNDCTMKALWYGEGFEEIASSFRIDTHPFRERRAEAKGVSASRRHPQSDDEIACLLYTSGTTGNPKGVMTPRRQLLWNGYNTVINWGLREDDVSPVFTPIYHAGGLAAFMIPIFCVGGTIVLHKAFDAAEVWRTIERERCTVVLGVPTIWKMLLEAPAFATANLDSVRWFISGGAPLPAFVADAYRRRGVAMRQGFGLTEVGVNCFTMTNEESRRKAGSIGRPLMFTEVKLLDAEEREVAVGEVGEIHIRGPHVSSGYWQNEAETAAAYLSEGWFKTGDLARRDEEGFFYIAGRRKEMFISGGVNVYPAEIENELLLHPAVNDAAVVAIPDDTWGEAGIAFVVARGVSSDELAAYLAERIAKYKVPKRFVFLDELPRSPYGKVEKVKLRERIGVAS